MKNLITAAFAFKARQCTGRYETDFGFDIEHGLEFMLQMILESIEFLVVLEEAAVFEFDADFDLIHVAFISNNDLVERLDLLLAHDDFLDLRREDIDAADDEHVVRTALNLGHAHGLSAAGAGFVVVYTGDILTMPGLPKTPAAENIDVDEKGRITGLF